MTTYFRVQDGNRSLDQLLDPDQVSGYWGRSDLDRPGVSVCESIEALARYLAGTGIPYGLPGWVLVELEGEEIDGADAVDAADGEVLIRPTRVVSSQLIPDELFEEIGRIYEESEDE